MVFKSEMQNRCSSHELLNVYLSNFHSSSPDGTLSSPLRVHEQRPRSSVETPESAGIGFLLVFFSFLVVEWEVEKREAQSRSRAAQAAFSTLRYV